VLTIARDLDMTNGVVFRDGALYVAEVSRFLRCGAPRNVCDLDCEDFAPIVPMNRDGTVAGRPADLLVMADGSLLVSDDRADATDRVTCSPLPV
jgi:hypothetical protein